MHVSASQCLICAQHGQFSFLCFLVSSPAVLLKSWSSVYLSLIDLRSVKLHRDSSDKKHRDKEREKMKHKDGSTDKHKDKHKEKRKEEKVIKRKRLTEINNLFVLSDRELSDFFFMKSSHWAKAKHILFLSTSRWGPLMVKSRRKKKMALQGEASYIRAVVFVFQHFH